MSEDEKRLLRAIWLSRSVANYSRPKYFKTLVERLRLRKDKGEGKMTIVDEDYEEGSSDEKDGSTDEEHEDILAFNEILQPSQLLKRGKFLD